MDIQTCPRRIMEMGPWDRTEGQDSWLEEPRHEGEVLPVCSFCGSLHPGKFLELVADGWFVSPTTKNYKAYLHEQPPGSRRSKFYYLHLSPGQQIQFIELYNRGTMRIGIPGHFNPPPFFMRIEPHPEG